MFVSFSCSDRTLANVISGVFQKFFPSLTKVVGTLGPNSRSVEVIEACLEAGMSVARFDFSWLDENYHQETLDNLRVAVKNVKRLCAVMLDTMGPALQVCNKSGNPIEMMAGNHVTITPDVTREPSAEILPVNYSGLANAVIKGDTIFVGQYLFTGIETTSIWLEVLETRGKDILCLVKNSATLLGSIFTMHASQVHIDLPTLTDADRQLRAFIKAQNLHETQIFAKVETVEGLRHFDEILEEADGIILSRGNLGIDLPPEKRCESFLSSSGFKQDSITGYDIIGGVCLYVGYPISYPYTVKAIGVFKVFLFQKSAIHRCNMIGKPAIITRVVDSMTANLRPTRAEATDVANAVLDGWLIAKYRPSVPVFAVVIPRLITNSLKWTFTGSSQATSGGSSEESGLKLALNHGKTMGLLKPNDQVVVFQKIGDSSVVKIVVFQDQLYS
ncbi:hypothetical protein C3L33_02197, partial [Rhododendron williamsianum]